MHFLIPLLMLLAAACAQEAPVPGAALPSARLVLPADIHAVVGHELNIYFDNAVLAPRPDAFHFDVTCSRGRQYADRWRFVPTAEDVGEYALSLKVLDEADNTLAEATTTVHVIPADAGAGKTFTLLCVGDSLTNASVYPHELWSLFGAEGEAQLRLIGTHRPSESLPPDVVHEGYGGWRWETFCTRWTDEPGPRARSPFLRLVDNVPTLDFQDYCDRINEGLGPDFITVLLGCNDNFAATDETIEASIDRMFTFADMLLAEFRRVRADTRIGLLLLPPPAASQDAFGTNYACGQTRRQYRRNQHRVVERMMERFAGQEAEGLFLLPAHLNLDTVNNYPTISEPANARNETTVVRQSNGVHPAASGYRQIADTIYYWLKGQLQ